MNEIVTLALPFFGIVLAGYLCGKLRAIPEAGLAWMDFFVIYVALPCLLFRIISQTPFDQLAQPKFVAATTLSTVCVFVIGFGLAALFRAQPRERAMAGLISGYGNLGYLGLPLALAVLGAEAAAPLALILCFDNMLLFVIVPILMSASPTGDRGLAVIARRVAGHPFLVGTVLGGIAAAWHWSPPPALDRAMAMLQSATAPCSLFTLGVSLALRPFQRLPTEVPWLVGVKLLVHPCLSVGLVLLIGGFPAHWVESAVLMAAMPPALNIFMVARQYQNWVEHASSSVLMGTLISTGTLTFVIWLIKTGAFR